MKTKTILLLFFLLAGKILFAQGGGPPMLTTDPGTPGNNRWEINSFVGYHFSVQPNMQIPSVEVVYGVGSRFQISAQLPLPELELKKPHTTTFSQPQMGVKYRFWDEEQNFLSLSVYPQIIFPLYKEQKTQIFIPIEMEKTFRNFRIGEEIGYFVLNNRSTFFSGTVVGYKFENDFELMGEFYCIKTQNKPQSSVGLLNVGIRKTLNEHLILMSSMGTQVITPANEDKEKLFGLIGLQVLLGK